jgi:hypothetical protein
MITCFFGIITGTLLWIRFITQKIFLVNTGCTIGLVVKGGEMTGRVVVSYIITGKGVE